MNKRNKPDLIVVKLREIEEPLAPGTMFLRRARRPGPARRPTITDGGHLVGLECPH